MKKIVTYNGKRHSNCKCSAPYQLVVGKMYEVVSQEIGKWQTNYTLKGITGEYDATWFNEVQVHFAVSNEVPIVGKCYVCDKFILNELRSAQLIGWCTSEVQRIELIANNTYTVTTLDAIYIVTVSK